MWRDAGLNAVAPADHALARALRQGGLGDTVEWLGPQHDLTPVGWHARRIHHDDGRALGTVVVCHDVTAVLAGRRSQEQFLGTLSHELRTPLTSIIGYVDIADSVVPDDAEPMLGRSLAAVRRNADHLARLLLELLEEAEERPQPHLRRVEVADLLHPVLDRWQTQFRDLGVALVVNLDGTICADVDPDHVIRVVDALASNAMKFTPTGGEVSVDLQQSGGLVSLVIADTGIGMSAVDLSRAFERFARGDAARVDAVPGIGLGLPTVKRLVEAHAGTVDVESQPGRGTTVTVRIPAARRPTLAG